MHHNDLKDHGLALVELMIVVAIALIIVGMAVPTFISTQRNFRAVGDAGNVTGEILVAKMRASSGFTQSRVYFDLTANTFRIEIWDKATSTWVVDAPTGIVNLSTGITLCNFAALPCSAQTNPPAGTQAAIAQPPACVTGASGAAPGAAIANSACIVFNSRGLPIDTTAVPTGNNAIYITDAKGVYSTTISITGNIRKWRRDVNDTNQANWNQR